VKRQEVEYIGEKIGVECSDQRRRVGYVEMIAEMGLISAGFRGEYNWVRWLVQYSGEYTGVQHPGKYSRERE